MPSIVNFMKNEGMNIESAPKTTYNIFMKKD